MLTLGRERGVRRVWLLVEGTNRPAVAVYRGESFIFLPGPSVGAGIRFFVWDWLSIRFDLRHYVLFNGVPILDPNGAIENVMALNAGVSFNFGGGG